MNVLPLFIIIICCFIVQIYELFSIFKLKRRNRIYSTLVMIINFNTVLFYGFLTDEFILKYDIIIYIGIISSIVYILNIVFSSYWINEKN